MSLILDALRKSEQERRQADPLVLNPIGYDPDPRTPARKRAPLITAGGTLLAALVAGAAFWFTGGVPDGHTVRMLEPMAKPTEPQLSIARAVSAPNESAPSTSEEVRPAPEFKASPFIAATSQTKTTVARDLAKEARVESPEPPPAAVSREERVAYAAPVESIPLRSNEPIKFLRAMPPDFQRALPELVVNIHIYAPREADRILYINNRQYHAGDKVREDIAVEEIVEDGAVLSFRGRLFKLARPS